MACRRESGAGLIDTFSILVSPILCVFVIIRAYRLDKDGRSTAVKQVDSVEAKWEAPWGAGN